MAELRIGILGTARIADKLCWAIEQTSTARVTAVASRSLERATAWAQVRGIAHVFGGYAELIESGVCDAVYVALPTALHAEWASRAADARLHVLCEKPLASSLVEAEAMSAACAAAGVVLLDGQMWPWHTRPAALLGGLGLAPEGFLVARDGRPLRRPRRPLLLRGRHGQGGAPRGGE